MLTLSSFSCTEKSRLSDLSKSIDMLRSLLVKNAPCLKSWRDQDCCGSKDLILYCRSLTKFFSTFDIDSFNFLNNRVSSIKVASMDLNNYNFINNCFKNRPSLYFNRDDSIEVQYILNIYKDTGKSINVMHCSSVYPLSDNMSIFALFCQLKMSFLIIIFH